MDDLDALLALEQVFLSDRLTRQRMRHWIRAANGILLVACEADTLLGYCLVIKRRDSRSVRLYSVVTAPPARGRGIAAKLLQAAEEHARQEGYEKLRLEVAAGNETAIKLYTGLNYTRFETVPGYYENGETAIRMQKRLK